MANSLSKMYLVPEDSLNRFREEINLESKLDSDMQKILKLKQIDDARKWYLYRQELMKFANNRRIKRNEKTNENSRGAVNANSFSTRIQGVNFSNAPPSAPPETRTSSRNHLFEFDPIEQEILSNMKTPPLQPNGQRLSVTEYDSLFHTGRNSFPFRESLAGAVGGANESGIHPLLFQENDNQNESFRPPNQADFLKQIQSTARKPSISLMDIDPQDSSELDIPLNPKKFPPIRKKIQKTKNVLPHKSRPWTRSVGNANAPNINEIPLMKRNEKRKRKNEVNTPSVSTFFPKTKKNKNLSDIENTQLSQFGYGKQVKWVSLR